ncbi:BON domain-containing protein [Undibacterium seohonense]|uniref:BON domain-containing protein n=1 Tax=Undibacterium seohonense TaxID=1344950 RepID=A0ABR6X0R1_9BURK|nr:BON domain-containing protein [Undibacterium seohonense]MBC3806538.1 BON domain-containing protein [Undibacterium seohonense]
MTALLTQKKTAKQSTSSNVLFGIVAVSLTLGSLAACNRSTEPVAPAASITIGTEVDDAVLTTKVKSALMADEYVKSLDIKVETFKADVMLSGFVDTQAQMDRGVEVTKAVMGVRNVNNKLSIKDGTQSVGNKIDDTVITASVKSAMLADPIMKSREVSVVTVKGEVQLSGYVDSETQISHASDVAKTVEGVVSVVNHMSVKK